MTYHQFTMLPNATHAPPTIIIIITVHTYTIRRSTCPLVITRNKINQDYKQQIIKLHNRAIILDAYCWCNYAQGMRKYTPGGVNIDDIIHILNCKHKKSMQGCPLHWNVISLVITESAISYQYEHCSPSACEPLPLLTREKLCGSRASPCLQQLQATHASPPRSL